MIGYVFAALISVCPNYQIVNKTGTWTAIDQQTLSYVIREGCAKQYRGSPCLKLFEKVDEQVYNVICTQKVKK